MANDSLVRLKLDSGEYENKIKHAQQGLLAMERECRKMGGTLAVLDKDQKNYVRSLGQMETKATTVRGKMGELSKAYTELRAQYNRLTAEEKRGDFGRALNKSLEQLRARVHEARTELNGISRELSGGMGNMGGAFNLEGMTGGLTKFAGTMGLAISAAGLFKEALSNNISTAMEFEDSISKLSSLTGMVGEDLDRLKGYAIELGGSTTQSASQVAQAFMLIGSQKPELLKTSEALRDVTKAAITLGEAANIDVTEAAKALTASLNIMGQGADQANRYINVLAAGSKEGAVDINGLTEIVFKAGQAATMNKLSFEQLIAVAEQIGPSFGSSAEAGTALNAMLLKLETQTNNKYKPSVVGLDEALKNLKEANLSASAATKLVTETGYKALDPLLKNTDALGNLTSAITGTNTAEDQAKTNTDNLKGSLARLDSAWERFNLTLNDSNGLLRSCIDLLAAGVNWMSDFCSKTDIATQALKRFNKENNSDNSSFHNAGTRSQQISEYNKRKHALDAEIEETRKKVAAQDKMLKDPKRNAYNRASIRPLYLASQKKLQALIEERRRLVEDGKRTFYPTDSPTTPDETPIAPTTSGTNTGKKGGPPKTPKVTKETLIGPPKTPKVTKETLTGPLVDLEKKLTDLQKAQHQASDTEEWKKYEQQILDVKDEIAKFKGELSDEDIKKTLGLVDKETISNLKLGQDVISGMVAELQKMPTTKTPFDYITEGAGALSARIDEIKDKLKNGDLGFAEYQRLSEELKNLEAFDLRITKGKVDKFLAPKEDKEEKKTMFKGFNDLTNGMSQMVSSMEQLGIDLPQGIEKGIGALQAISGLVSSILTIVTAIETISAADALIPLHTGGLVHAANGVFVPGAYNGGLDTVPAILSPGELVLNAAQQSNLATQLQANAQQRNDNLGVRVRGEDMYTAIDNYMRRTGKRFSA